MNCQIISIGDELLLGDTVNTNASWLGTVLAGQGVQVTAVHTIADNANQIKQTVREGLTQADLVITTGGLGPTHDDITKKAIADLFDAEMVIHQPTLAFIKDVFKKRNIPFSESNYHQAEVPEQCGVLVNKQGTAPGLWFEQEGHYLAVLPGIPHEVKALMEHQVIPRIEALTGETERTFSRHIKVAGIGESTLSDEIIGPLGDFLSDDLSVAYLPSAQANTIRINTRAGSKQEAENKSRDLVNYIYEKARMYIIGEGKELSLSQALGEVLTRHGLTIATAESCTGGLLADTLTNVPGSSEYMVGGVVAYANQVKINQLHVSEQTLKTHGAVSKAVALKMAKRVANMMETDIGVSITGIAGPGGGTDEKPVGTVWIGFWSQNRHFALKTLFTNNRLLNKERSVAVALETIRRAILEIETMPYGLNPHFA